MASETDLFGTAIGLLVKKDQAEAKKLKEDDIVREIDYIKFQLNALARSQLLTSITFFKEGVLSLLELFNKGKRNEYHNDAGHSEDGARDEHMGICARSLTDPVNTVSQGLKYLKLANLNEKGERVLLTAKDDFKQARTKAIEAFNNEALSTTNRIQAIEIRAAAKVLENVDHPDEALAVCRLCLQDLHSIKEVQQSFGTEINKGFKYRLNIDKDERRQIISSVCRINRAIYDLTSMVGKGNELQMLPLINNGKELVNPLHDPRVAEILGKLDVEHYSVTPLSLGQTEGNDNKVKIPQGIATNSQGHFIVGDEWDRNVKVFDCIGKYQYSLPCTLSDSSDSNAILSIVDVATDINDNVHVLIELQKSGSACYRVYVFNKQAECRYFPLTNESGEDKKILRMTVNNDGDVLVLADSSEDSEHSIKCSVQVYNTDGHCSPKRFEDEHLKCAQDISVARDGRVIVLDRVSEDTLSIHVFHSDGKHSFQFKVTDRLMTKFRPSAACYQVLSNIAMAVPCEDSGDRARHFVKILTYVMHDSKLEFIRSIEHKTCGLVSTRGITVTVQGHIAVGVLDKSEGDSRVLVV